MSDAAPKAVSFFATKKGKIIVGSSVGLVLLGLALGLGLGLGLPSSKSGKLGGGAGGNDIAAGDVEKKINYGGKPDGAPVPSVADFKSLKMDLLTELKLSGTQTGAHWLRLAFHDVASFDGADGLGKFDASLQFQPERGFKLNAGLEEGIMQIQKIYDAKYKATGMSLADAWALAAAATVESFTGSVVRYRGGRVDAKATDKVAPEARITDGDATLPAVEAQAARLGYTTQEFFTLISFGHSIGNAHPTVSGWDGHFTSSKESDFLDMGSWLTETVGNHWTEITTAAGKKQFEAMWLDIDWTVIRFPVDFLIRSLPTEMRLYFNDLKMKPRSETANIAAPLVARMLEIGCDKKAMSDYIFGM